MRWCRGNLIRHLWPDRAFPWLKTQQRLVWQFLEPVFRIIAGTELAAVLFLLGGVLGILTLTSASTDRGGRRCRGFCRSSLESHVRDNRSLQFVTPLQALAPELQSDIIALPVSITVSHRERTEMLCLGLGAIEWKRERVQYNLEV